jgi:glycosyltransferase involved in cell wall biosynthesis
MRIAMVSTPFVDVPPKGYGGTELIVHALSEGLAARGHEVVLFATGRSRIPGEVRYRFEAARWPPTRQDDLEHLAFAFEEIGRDPLGFDAVHVHSPMALPFARALGISVAYTLHHEQKPELSRLYQRFPEAAFIAISARQRALEVPLPDISVIHHGLDARRYPLDRRRIRRRARERFGHLRMVDEHLALYRRLAQGRPDVLAGTAQEAASF